MRNVLFACVVALAAGAGCSVSAEVEPIPPGPAVLTVSNQSDFTITALYVTPVDSSTWGPNLLGGDVLLSGEAIDIAALDCATYDVMITDEFNTDCVLESVRLCFTDKVWRIDNGTLVSCAFP